jgi:murein L,D-transpeptidase YcbB/YkuD
VADIDAAATRAKEAPDREARAAALADLEIRFTQAYLAYGSDLSRGRIDPDRTGAQWYIDRAPPDGDGLLRDAAGSEKISDILRKRLPRFPLYAALRAELARYRALAEKGWPSVSANVKLRRNDRGKAVVQLRKRLAAEGFLEPGASESSDRFDAPLETALRSYQALNGLDVDGVAGRDTVAALNVSAAGRADQIALNMERLRWLPRSLGDRYIFVDVPGFRLLVFEQDRVAFSSPVIVGRDDRPTPIFSATMNHVVFNPFWRVPRSIAVKDKLDEIRKDPNYLEEHQIEVFRYEKGGGTTPVDPATVDWNSVTANNFGYLFRQRPGDENALGRVKFMFPNPYSVYIHDTPTRYLFRRTKRTYSSGCIRVAKPLDLGAYLMAGNPGWSREKFQATMAGGTTRTVQLRDQLPVYVVYLTAWAERGGPVQFRRDIYSRDRALALALAGGNPSRTAAATPLPEAGP